MKQNTGWRKEIRKAAINSHLKEGVLTREGQIDAERTKQHEV